MLHKIYGSPKICHDLCVGILQMNGLGLVGVVYGRLRLRWVAFYFTFSHQELTDIEISLAPWVFPVCNSL